MVAVPAVIGVFATIALVIPYPAKVVGFPEVILLQSNVGISLADNVIPYPAKVVGIPVVILLQSKSGISLADKDVPLTTNPFTSYVIFVAVPAVIGVFATIASVIPYPDNVVGLFVTFVQLGVKSIADSTLVNLPVESTVNGLICVALLYVPAVTPLPLRVTTIVDVPDPLTSPASVIVPPVEPPPVEPPPVEPPPVELNVQTPLASFSKYPVVPDKLAIAVKSALVS